jgi:P27 family predicted phage terminase small subunit
MAYQKPTALKLLQGNPGKKPLPKNEPQVTGSPECPKGLSPKARAQFAKMKAYLEAVPGLVGSTDSLGISMLASTWAEMIEASRHVEEEGLFLTSELGIPYQNPWLSIRRKAEDHLLKLLDRFGLNPAARAKVQVQVQTKTTETLDSFLEESA